jgi:hypothetical protein
MSPIRVIDMAPSADVTSRLTISAMPMERIVVRRGMIAGFLSRVCQTHLPQNMQQPVVFHRNIQFLVCNIVHEMAKNGIKELDGRSCRRD